MSTDFSDTVGTRDRGRSEENEGSDDVPESGSGPYKSNQEPSNNSNIQIPDIYSFDLDLDFCIDPQVNAEFIKAIVKAWMKNLQSALGKRLNKVIKGKELRERLKTEPFLRAKDKVSFLLGVLTLVFTEFVLISCPQHLYVVYTVLLFPLLIWRFMDYHRNKLHYFMLDYCYFANVLTLIWLYVFPKNLALYKTTFALCTGPLLMAVIAWSNALVFHDLDRVTSFFIHFYPPLILFAERWFVKDLSRSHTEYQINSMSFYEGFFVPIIFYLIWQIFYWLKTEVMDRNRLKNDADVVTSFRWLTRLRPHFLYSWLKARNINFYPIVLFSIIQLLYTIVTLTPVLIAYKSQWFHLGLMISIFVFACWNGANYYFDIFSQNYTKRLRMKSLEAQMSAGRPVTVGFFPSSLPSVVRFGVWSLLHLGAIFLSIFLLC